MKFLIIAIILIALVILLRQWENKIWWKKYDAKPFNFPFKYKGRTLWHSRSCAVAGFIFCKNQLGEWCILANQRGKGAPDYQFYHNAVCGYLDFGESSEEAISRETQEECGIYISPNEFKLYGVQSDSSANKQNVTIRYFVKIEDRLTDDPSLDVHITNLGEKDEVADVSWIPISVLKEYNWAFGHKDIIEQIFDRI